MAAVQARETARINAMYIMAERHNRNWDSVRVRLLSHCDRAGFAEVAWYRKPAGKKQINGQWKEVFAEGLSTRFAEVARQEMHNTNTETSIVFEDESLRIIRASVVDLECNSIESREMVIPKTVERKGRQAKDGTWLPPEGREVISERVNTWGDPIYTVKATEDEIRNRQNSEISKATRDGSLRLIPKDIRDDCARRIYETKMDPNKTDPTEARKRIIDAFAALGVMPEDLQSYLIDTPMDRISPAQLDDLRGLYSAIHDGEITFQDALKTRFESGEGETKADRDIRLQRAMDAQAARLKADDPKPGKAGKQSAEEKGIEAFKKRLAACIEKDQGAAHDAMKKMGYKTFDEVPATEDGRELTIAEVEEACGIKK